MRVSRTSLSVMLALGGSAIAVCAAAFSSFLSAGAGSAVPFETVALPPVSLGGGAPGLRSVLLPSPFNPSKDTLLNGQLVITSAAQMQVVWNQLFSAPYNPALFDFQNTFVVLMGAGLQQSGVSFGISSVEVVTASYSDLGGFGGGTADDPFLSVTSTTFFPGTQQSEPPPPAYLVSAVKVSKALQDDVVFHRALVFGV